MAGIVSIIYLILGYWACGEVFFAKSNSSHFLSKLFLGAAFGWLLIPIAIIKIKFKDSNSDNNLSQGIVTANSKNIYNSSPVKDYIKEIEDDPEEMAYCLTRMFTVRGFEFVPGVVDDEADIRPGEVYNSYYIEDPNGFYDKYLDKVVIISDVLTDIKIIENNEVILTFGDLKVHSSNIGIKHRERVQCFIDAMYWNDISKLRVGQRMLVIGQISKEMFERLNEICMVNCIPMAVDNKILSKAKELCVGTYKIINNID